MIDVLHLIFRDFWTFFGTLLLVGAAARFRPIYIDKSITYGDRTSEDD